MDNVAPHFRLDVAPIADEDAVVRGPRARFTVLTSRLLRLEYDPDEIFEDRASQLVWYREQPVPEFEVRRRGEQIDVITEHVHLRYRPGPAGFTAESLSIERKESGRRWRYGDRDEHNLRGTARTLDLVSGATELEPGLLSRSGHAVIDDSQSLVFNDEGWLEKRDRPGTVDVYYFGYGHDYRAWLGDYARLAGRAPLLPRWALGNWWSRYWAYTQEELTELMQAFRERRVPLSVCIIDMDWHITETENQCSGWTGYTWNRELFPEPEAFLDWLHEQGLKTALNLHPAEGVHPHEKAYEEVARFMGIDPETERPVPFDVADPRFVRAYFEKLHHPLEEQGVDFWWMDWQQGTDTGLAGLDPLWWLNHLHFYDRGRDGRKRPFIFSRWGGLGNHRYPIGFSGDTYVNWPTLAFQPYHTATAANVLYGWWSHDIGGHMQGVEEAELYARWVQFGVFSPIMRLHSTNNPYHERRPWGYDAETLRVTREAMQLRHALIPYLYTMSWRSERESVPAIRPMYHDYPEMEAAYHCPNQYFFGSELIAAPFVSPADPDTRLARQVVWLPPGDWYHFFDGRRFSGDSWRALYGGLDEIPLLARAGAIVPLGPTAGWGGVENPASLNVYVFPGAESRFELYEDDGETVAYRKGAYALTPMAQKQPDGKLVFTMGPVEGDASQTPAERTYRLHFRGVERPGAASAHVDGEAQPVDVAYDPETCTATVGPLTITPASSLSVTLTPRGERLPVPADDLLPTLRHMVEAFRLQTSAKAAVVERLEEIAAEPALLAEYAVELADGHRRALLEVMTGSGVEHNRNSGRELIVLWNNHGRNDVVHRLSVVRRREWEWGKRFRSTAGPVPRFRAIVPEETWGDTRWELSLAYGDLLALRFDGES